MRIPPSTRVLSALAFGLASFVLLGCGGGKPADLAASKGEDGKTPAVTPAEKPDAGKAPAPTPPPAPPPTSSPIPARGADAALPAEPIAKSEVAQAAKDKDADAKAQAAAAGADAMKWLQENEAKKAEYAKQLAAAQTKLTEADASVAEWEKNVLAYKIPYRARPVLTTKDADEVAGKGGAERIQWAEDKLTEARNLREQAQQTLNDLKASPPQ